METRESTPASPDDRLNIARSPALAFTTSLLLLGSCAMPPKTPNLPPFTHRFGFSLIMGFSSYVLATGDVKNGSGITTAWSLSYLFLNARKAFARPIQPISLGLVANVAACAAVYGNEYFFNQGDEAGEPKD